MSRSSPTTSPTREQAIAAIKRLKLHPGSPAPASGQYTMRLRDGTRRQCTMVRGRRLPASPPGTLLEYWKLTDATKRQRRR